MVQEMGDFRELEREKRPLVIVCGPTGVGKSVYALRLAAEVGGEIVNADSQQVYRGCDIGTGKLALADRQGIPHHCLDIADPDQPFHAAHYVTAADTAIAGIVARHTQPIIVGGTGLYLKALVYGLCEAPPANPQLRAEFEAACRAHGSAVLHARLATVDPAAAAQIHPHHVSRIIRALEVYQLTGQSIRAWQAAHNFTTPRYAARWIGLTVPRPQLYARIDQRVETMIARGWVDDVRTLIDRYGPDIAALKAIGYRELAAHLQGADDLPTTIARIKQATRRYAKRQLTWFRAMSEVEWS